MFLVCKTEIPSKIPYCARRPQGSPWMRDRGAGPSQLPPGWQSGWTGSAASASARRGEGATQGGQSLSRMVATKSDVRCRWCIRTRSLFDVDVSFHVVAPEPAGRVRGEVRRLANDAALLRLSRSDQVAHNYMPSRDADAGLKRAGCFQTTYCSDQLQPRPHRPLGVVLGAPAGSQSTRARRHP
jgi:hypothetical protein